MIWWRKTFLTTELCEHVFTRWCPTRDPSHVTCKRLHFVIFGLVFIMSLLCYVFYAVRSALKYLFFLIVFLGACGMEFCALLRRKYLHSQFLFTKMSNMDSFIVMQVDKMLLNSIPLRPWHCCGAQFCYIFVETAQMLTKHPFSKIKLLLERRED